MPCVHGGHDSDEYHPATDDEINEWASLRTDAKAKTYVDPTSTRTDANAAAKTKALKKRRFWFYLNPLRWIYWCTLAFLDLYRWLLNLGAFAHGGVSYLGMIEILAVLSGVILILGASPLAIPLIAGLVGAVCGIEAMSLEVPTAQDLILRTRKGLQKSFDIENPKDSFEKMVPHWRAMIPFFLWPALWFKLYFTLFGWPIDILDLETETEHEDDEEIETTNTPLTIEEQKRLLREKKRKDWLLNLKQRSWPSVLLAPMITAFGPLAEGAEFWMGLIPILYFIGLAESAGGGLLPLGFMICIVGFVIAATSNYALNTQSAIKALNKGTHGIKDTLKSMFTFKALDIETKPVYYRTHAVDLVIENEDLITTDDGRLILLKEGKPVLDKNGCFVSVSHNALFSMATRPVFDKKGRRLLVTDAGIPLFNSESDPLYLDEVTPLRYKDGMPVLDTDESGDVISNKPVVDIDGNLLVVRRLKSRTLPQRVKTGGKLLKKGIFETIFPSSLGMLVWLVGPIVAAGAAFLGMSTMFAGPWVPVVAAFVALVAGIQNACLEGNAAFEMLQKFGRAVDRGLRRLKHFIRENGVFSTAFFRPLLRALRALVPDIILKIGVLLFGINDPELRNKSWLKAAIQVLVAFLKLIIGIFGPFAHGAEAFRESQPVFLAIFLVLIGTGALAFPPALVPAITALAAIAFVVSMIQNRSLEVTAAYEKIDQFGDRLEQWFRRVHEAPWGEKLDAAMHPRPGKPFGYRAEKEMTREEQKSLPKEDEYDALFFDRAGKFMLHGQDRRIEQPISDEESVMATLPRIHVPRLVV